MTTRVTSSSSTSAPSQPQQEITEAAKNWTKCLERFKISIDSLYDICRETQNFAGCRFRKFYYILEMQPMLLKH
jgi:hypothetical protein